MTYLCNLIVLILQQFLDFLDSLVPLPQNSQRVKSNLKQPNVDIMYAYKAHTVFLEKNREGGMSYIQPVQACP